MHLQGIICINFQLIFMGTQSSIDIKLVTQIDLINILKGLSYDLWRFDVGESISYLPIGDKDFDWKFLPKNEVKSVLEIIETKLKNSEMIGVSIYNLNIDSGFLVHYYPQSNSIMLLLNINRLKIRGTRFTNFSSYLTEIFKIIPDYQIGNIICEDV